MISINPTSFKILVLILLCTCTIIFFNNYLKISRGWPGVAGECRFPRWARSLEALQNGHHLVCWKQYRCQTTRYICIESTSLSQVILAPQCFKLLRLSCDIKTQNIIGGDKDWKTARVVLISHSKEGTEIYSLPCILAQQPGLAIT
jgi:hypothetical protein